MVIYYTYRYCNNKGESHRLLARAVAMHLASAAGLDEGKALKEASRLTASLAKAGEFGKPYIPGFAPFSISHSNNTWAVLIMESAGLSECGLDIQYERKADPASIAGRFFAPEDAEQIEELRAAADTTCTCGGPEMNAQAREFFRLWTRREALVKAAGSSVADSEVPAVSGDIIRYRDRTYVLKDIVLPTDTGTCTMPGSAEQLQQGAVDSSISSERKRLHAAVCVRTGRMTEGKQTEFCIKYRQL